MTCLNTTINRKTRLNRSKNMMVNQVVSVRVGETCYFGIITKIEDGEYLELHVITNSDSTGICSGRYVFPFTSIQSIYLMTAYDWDIMSESSDGLPFSDEIKSRGFIFQETDQNTKYDFE